MADSCCTPPPLQLDRAVSKGAGDCCCAPPQPADNQSVAGYRRVLWTVLIINATMFLVEVSAGLAAGSASLQADALDFLGDAANYGISLLVVGMALHYRASAALAKAATHGRLRRLGHRDGHLALAAWDLA